MLEYASVILSVVALIVTISMPFIIFYVKRVSCRIDTLFEVTENIKDNYISDQSISDKLKPIELEISHLSSNVDELSHSVSDLNIFKAVTEKQLRG